MNDETMKTLRVFWSSFENTLYDAGFGEFVVRAKTANSETDFLIAISYIEGAADLAKLANDYGSRGWQMASMVGLASSRMVSAILNKDEELAVAIAHSCTRGLNDLLGKNL